MNNNTNHQIIDETMETLENESILDQTFNRKKIITSVTAIAASIAVAAGLVISAGADEAEKVSLTYSGTAETADSSTGSFVLTDVSDVVKSALPSVVSITSRTIYNNYNEMIGYGYSPNEIFDYYYGDSNGGSSSNQESADNESADSSNTNDSTNNHSNEVDSGIGSGTIIAINESEVLILTSYHVVEDCSSLYVTFNNGTNIDGYIKSAIIDKDIAVVGISVENIDEETLSSIKAAPIATEDPEVGDGIIVIGNAMGYGISVTTGIISAVDRQITIEGKTLDVIQTDAAINSGNSGGCMLNSRGEVVGISEAKVVVENVEGMCYAIPVVSNTDLIEKLINNEGTYTGDVVEDKGGFLGIKGRNISSDTAEAYGMPEGVYISELVEGYGAQAAGLKTGDIITAVNGETVTSSAELSNKVISHAPGETITITIARASEGEYILHDIEVTLTENTAN